MHLKQIIYLLRHGETELNVKGRYQGELDSKLTSDGIEQVKKMHLINLYFKATILTVMQTTT